MNIFDENLEVIETCLAKLKDYFERKNVDFVVAWGLAKDEDVRAGIAHSHMFPDDFAVINYEWVTGFGSVDENDWSIDKSHLE